MNPIIRCIRIAWYVLTLQCDEADRLRCVSDPSELAAHQRLAERLHRVSCASCRRAKRHVDELRRLMHESDAMTFEQVQPGLPSDAAARIADRLRHDA